MIVAFIAVLVCLFFLHSFFLCFLFSFYFYFYFYFYFFFFFLPLLTPLTLPTGDCNCGGGGLDCNCSGCKGDGAKGLLILFIIFAVIGVFVLFYVGGTFMGRRYNRRSKKLLFLSSAKEERVADLSKVPVGERDKLDQLHCRMI